MFSCAHAEKKEIKSSEIVKLIKKGKSVQITDKIILDDLDFLLMPEFNVLNANALQVDVDANIFFNNCVFMGKVSSNGKMKDMLVQTRFKNNLVFIDCDFRSEVDFENAIIEGMVNFNKSIFRENASFNGMAVWAKNSYFSEIKAEKRFNMIYASFMGNVYCIGSIFNDVVSFQETSVNGKFSLNTSVFNKRTDLGMIQIGRSASFNYTVFNDNVTFALSQFIGSTDFVNTTFEKSIDFEKTCFLNTVRFIDIQQKEDLKLENAIWGTGVKPDIKK